MSALHIRPLQASPAILARLSAILVDVVANGGSVGFMHPLPLEAAAAFWEGALASAERGERIVLGAWYRDEPVPTDSHAPAAGGGPSPSRREGQEDGMLVGTVSLVLNCPPNQPHRAEIAKMMTCLSHRGRGVATALLLASEALAEAHGRSLLVLDTATEDGAAGLYRRLGFTLAGEIPDYALKPHGGLTGTLIFWKRIGPAPSRHDAFGDPRACPDSRPRPVAERGQSHG